MPFLLTIVLEHLVRLKLKLHPVMPDRPTPDPRPQTPILAGHMFVLGRVGRQFPRQAFSQATVSHGTVFPPGDFPFPLGLPRSVKPQHILLPANVSARFLKRLYLFSFREREMEGEREGETSV